MVRLSPSACLSCPSAFKLVFFLLLTLKVFFNRFRNISTVSNFWKSLERGRIRRSNDGTTNLSRGLFRIKYVLLQQLTCEEKQKCEEIVLKLNFSYYSESLIAQCLLQATRFYEIVFYFIKPHLLSYVFDYLLTTLLSM